MPSRIGLRPFAAAPFAAALSGLAVIVAAGCGDPYMGEYRYKPNPYSTTVASSEEGANGPVQVLASVRGVRQAEQGDGVELVTNLYFENLTGRSVRVDPTSLAAFSADLERFGDPRTEPAEPVTIEAGESQRVRARFPFPKGVRPGELDMSGLSMRWAVQIGEDTLTRNTTFTRLPNERARYYRSSSRHYWGSGYGFHTGLHFQHGW